VADDKVMERLGAYVFPWGVEPPTVADLVTTARYAEELGFGSLQIAWHFTGDAKFGNTENLDPLVVTPILLAETEHIKISINSIILSVVHPYFWARYLAHLDLISGGRVIPAVALGWHPDDFRIGLARTKERGRRFDEALDIYSRLVRSEPITEPGQFWDATGLELEPPARADLPLWIGAGEISIPRAARWGTALNPTRCDIAAVAKMRQGLDEAAAAQGRSVELVITQSAAVILPGDSEAWQDEHVWSPLNARPKDRDASGSVIGSPEVCAQRLRDQFAAGADRILLEVDFHGGIPAGDAAREQLTRIARDVAPLVAQ
jgi:alkanesulfonate monooxygenase SsuD/methylene tetrahydromethanopterin reductase-like flavin-dependent oxidoreductase (luciferase family)